MTDSSGIARGGGDSNMYTTCRKKPFQSPLYGGRLCSLQAKPALDPKVEPSTSSEESIVGLTVEI